MYDKCDKFDRYDKCDKRDTGDVCGTCDKYDYYDKCDQCDCDVYYLCDKYVRSVLINGLVCFFLCIVTF